VNKLFSAWAGQVQDGAWVGINKLQGLPQTVGTEQGIAQGSLGGLYFTTGPYTKLAENLTSLRKN
jgi:hypothetical protein